MKRVTLKFSSLQRMADCMYSVGITRPAIDYDLYTLTADLSDKQLEELKEFQVEMIELIVLE